MASQVYEGMFILDPNQYARDPSGTSAQAVDLITKFGGEILVSRLWDERKLAYPIEGHRKGTYWLTYFRMETDKLITLKREFEINDSIMRHMMLKVDARLVDALIEHAKSGHAPEIKTSDLGGPRTRPAETAVVEEEEADGDEMDDK